jgi:hypothetical protein
MATQLRSALQRQTESGTIIRISIVDQAGLCTAAPMKLQLQQAGPELAGMVYPQK